MRNLVILSDMRSLETIDQGLATWLVNTNVLSFKQDSG